MRLLDEKDLSAEPANERTAGQGDVSLFELLIVLARRKQFILNVVGIFTFATLIAAFALPSWYTAATSLLPPSQNSSLNTALMTQLGNLGSLASAAGSSLGIKNPNEMYAAMLRSRTVEDAMIERFQLRKVYGSKRLSDARKKFESHSSVEASTNDGLIRIAVEDKDPNRAAEMANAYVEEFKKLTAGLAITEAAQRRVFFEQQLLETKNDLAQAEEELKRTQQTTGMLQLDSEARALIESAAALRAQVAAKEVQIRAMRSYASENNPDLILQKQQLAELQSQLVQLAGGKQGGNSDPVLPRKKVSEAGLEYVRRLRDVKYYETIFALLARQLELAKLDEAKQGAVVQVVDQAIPPDRRSFPLRSLWVGSALFASLFLACAWVILSSFVWPARKRSQEEEEKIKILRALVWKSDT